MVMAMGACSFLAPTAPAMAMEPETPHTAPPAPKSGAQPAVEPKLSADEIDHQKRRDGNDGSLNDRHRPGPDDQSEGQCCPEQHDPGLDVVFDPKAGIHPARQSNQVGNQHAQYQSHQGRLQIILIGTDPRPRS